MFQAQAKAASEKTLRFYASNRPLNISVSIAISNVCLYLPEFVRINESCPIARTDLVLIEVSNSMKEVRLQVISAPLTIILPNCGAWERGRNTSEEYSPMMSDERNHRSNSRAAPKQSKLSSIDPRLEMRKASEEKNRLTLAGFQFRMQAFSDSLEGPERSVSVEYAYLIEVKVLPLRGKINMSQLLDLVECVQKLIFLMNDPSCKLQQGTVDVGYVFSDFLKVKRV